MNGQQAALEEAQSARLLPRQVASITSQSSADTTTMERSAIETSVVNVLPMEENRLRHAQVSGPAAVRGGPIGMAEGGETLGRSITISRTQTPVDDIQ